MKFTMEYISSFENVDYLTFAEDLRKYFPTLADNNAIIRELFVRLVVDAYTIDPIAPECTCFYFGDQDQAQSFLDRLNALPEIANYEKPEDLPLRYTMEDIVKPVDEDVWIFADDFRKYFPTLTDNHAITKELHSRGVVGAAESDTESACSYFYFKDPSEAQAFLDRLNDLPEIANYEEPQPPPAVMVAMSQSDWKQLKAFLADTLTPEQHAALKALNTQLWEIEN